MKTIAKYLAVALLISTTAMAQENISIGPLVGVSIANLRGDIANNNWKAGLTAGGFFNYSSNSGLGVSGQVLFTQLGAQINNKTNDINLNYIQVPVLLTYFLGDKGNSVRPKVFVGPHVNFLLAAKDRNGNDISGESNNPNYNSIDGGLTLGAGFNYRIQNKIWLNVDARYGLGLVDITKSAATELRNQNFGINVGVSFPFGTYNERKGTINTR